MKNEREKSDPSKVAKRPGNKPKLAEVDLWAGGAESVEPREGTEGNTGEQQLAAKVADATPDFSRLIRTGLPGF